jgi:hypothetical protein
MFTSFALVDDDGTLLAQVFRCSLLLVLLVSKYAYYAVRVIRRGGYQPSPSELRTTA